MDIYVELLSTFLQMFLLSWFISKFFGYKTEEKSRIIGFVCVVLIVFAETLFLNSIILYEGLLAGIVIVTHIIYARLCLKGTFFHQIFISLFAYALLYTISTTILFVCAALSGYTVEALISVPGSLRTVILIAARITEFLVFSYIVKINHEYILTKKEWVLFASMPLLTWMAVTIMVNATIVSEEIFPYMLYIVLILLAINVSIYYFMLKIKKDANTRMEYELLKMQYNNMRSTEANMRALYESTYSLKHDLDKHLFAVKEMAKSKNCDDITRYIERVIDTANEATQKIVFTDNDIFNAIVNAKLELCKQKAITVNIRIDKAAVAYLEIGVIVVVLGNIFDNAIEAACNAEDKKINLYISLKRDYVSVYMENSFDKNHSDIKLNTTKRNSAEHGFGIKNVRKAIEENGGMVDFYTNENGLFCCDMLLQKQ